MFYFFLAEHVFFLLHPPRAHRQSGCGFDCCVHLPYINIARTCRPPPMLEKGGGFPTHPPSFNTLAVFIMCSLPYKLTISSLVSAYHISKNMKYDFLLSLTKYNTTVVLTGPRVQYLGRAKGYVNI